MNQYETFIFESYSFDPAEGRIELRYSLTSPELSTRDDDVKFVEILTLPKSYEQTLTPELEAALFALHLIGGISYYKTCCPKKIEIRSGTLTEDQAAFWNAVYENGLGEFFYRNDIDFHGLINFPSSTDNKPENQKPITNNQSTRLLVPLGGGKDSIVTIELLKKAGADITLFRLGGHPLIDACVKVAKLPILTVKRQLSPALFDLNEQGALNGHVPITAYLSCLTVIIAILEDFDAIAMSNERSANIGNVMFKGKEINHQWSKSLEFERMFRDYVAANIAPDIVSFSLLRPLSELHITKLFTALPQYFSCATSCNANWKIVKEQSGRRWCGTCPKCAFAFALFAAFLPGRTLEEIFDTNLFENASLIPLYKELLGLEGFKPFECVGTPEETKAAFLLAHEHGNIDDTPVMKLFLSEVLPSIKKPKELIDEALTLSDDHAIPDPFLKILDENC